MLLGSPTCPLPALLDSCALVPVLFVEGITLKQFAGEVRAFAAVFQSLTFAAILDVANFSPKGLCYVCTTGAVYPKGFFALCGFTNYSAS